MVHRDIKPANIMITNSGLLPRGRIDEAMVEIEGVLRTDPLSLFVRWWVAVITYLAHRPARMVEEGRHMIALDPAHFLGHWALGLGLEGTGRPAEAVRTLEKAHELSGGMPFTLGFLAFLYGRAGRRNDAHKLLEHAGQIAAMSYVPPSVFVLGYAGLEDWEAVLDGLDRAIEARDPLVMPIKTYPFLDPVRSDPRYRALLKKMNLE